MNMRYIVYEMKDGSEERFPLYSVEDEQHERAQAERELHSRDTSVMGYHFEEVSHFEEVDRRMRRKYHAHTGN